MLTFIFFQERLIMLTFISLRKTNHVNIFFIIIYVCMLSKFL